MSANIPPDDRLARAEAALRDVPMPDGPSEESLARALAVARAAGGKPGVVPWTWRRAMLSTLKVAAALVAASGVLYVARPPKATAFEEVAQKLHDARTMVYRATSINEGAPAEIKSMTMKLFFRVPGFMRVETEVADAFPVSILDTARGRMVVLDTAKKSAMVMENAKPPEDFAAKTVEHLRNLPGKDARPVGRERIGDVEAEGYRVEEHGGTMVAWVDPKTRLPVRIDVTNTYLNKPVRATLSDFQLDPPLDDSLFRAEPPEGYSVQTINGGMLFAKPEVAVVHLLRLYAEHYGGTFPKGLEDPDFFKALDAIFPKPKDAAKTSFTKTDPRVMDLIMSLSRVLSLRHELKGFGYKADGVKLGDADKIIFWYRPDGSETYRVVYGDLHVGDVAADQLPEKPKP
jgi:outer membrane lipoprotein-sorting protein